MDPVSLIRTPDFPSLISRKLSEVPSDFPSTMAQITAENGAASAYGRAAGVLLPLHRYSGTDPEKAEPGEWCFQLIKRSARMSQPGDIGCPGGMIHPSFDHFLSFFIRSGLLPVYRPSSRADGKAVDREATSTIALFLTTALRESWEEIGLPPWNVRCLGALPTHTLTLFRRTIFPLVGILPRPYRPQLSAEVERILEIPVRSFLDPSLYADLVIEVTDDIRPSHVAPRRPFPSFLVKDGAEEDVLWGATFNIIVRFFKIVLDLDIVPARITGRTIVKRMGAEYITGRR
jgi:8-oxo-dGTP pyrophosphatase MutT (NUDIX family)